jgi:hypothetical protein
VGFAVNQLRSYSCSEFLVYFLLWGNGGPNFAREFDLWQREELDNWTHIGRKARSFANAVRVPLTGANCTVLGNAKGPAPSYVRPPVPAQSPSLLLSAKFPVLKPKLAFVKSMRADLRLLLEDFCAVGYDLQELLDLFRKECRTMHVLNPLADLTEEHRQGLSELLGYKLMTSQLG